MLVGNAWAQSAVTMKFQPGKLMNWYYLIVPEQGHYFFESKKKYENFKYNNQTLGNNLTYSPILS